MQQGFQGGLLIQFRGFLRVFEGGEFCCVECSEVLFRPRRDFCGVKPPFACDAAGRQNSSLDQFLNGATVFAQPGGDFFEI